MFLACGPQTSDDEPSRPQRTGSVPVGERSVVIITLDTTRPDRLQPYGAQDVATPTLQRLAARGVVFENAWAVAPITLVSHTSILSGLYPFEHGVRNNGMQYVSDSITTLTERLADEGYRTSAFVSAAVLDDRYGLAQGFEVYDDDLSDRRNRSPRMVADRPAENTVDATTAWLDTLGDDEPFFTWVHFYDPHASYSPPPPFRDEYRDRLYDGEVAYMDAEIGRLLQHPRLLGAGEDAPIVLVIGDHGESLGEHGERTHAILAYDSTLAIPFILHVPGGPAGLRVDTAVGQVDVMPTLLSLLDLEPQEGISGRDLVPVLEGRNLEPNRHYYSETYLPYYTYGWAKLKVLHKGRWKIIDAPTPELYDRQRDPRELTNVFEQQAGLAHDMQRDLDEWLSQYDADTEASLSLDSEALAKLASLGYLSVGSGRQEMDDDERPNPMEMIEQHVGLERARQLLADRLYGQAERQLESVLRRDPNNLAALLDLIRAKEGNGDIEGAVAMAERALSLDPEYTQTYMHLARLEAQREELGRAVELTDIAIEKDPINPELQVLKANFLNRMGKHEETEAVLKATLADHADHPRTNAIYAHLVESRQGKWDEAEARLLRSLEIDPFQDQTWLFLGRVQQRLGKLETAEQSFRQGLTRRPDNSDLHGALGNLLARLGRPNEAIPQLQEAIRLSEKFRTEFHVSLGGMFAEQGRLEEAQREYDKVLAVEPSHPGARNNKAIAFYRLGRLDEADALLRDVVQEFPKHADAHNNLAAIAVDQQRWQEAIQHSRRTLDLAPRLVEAWNNLGIGLEETGKLGEAEEAYGKALELDPNYWPAYFNTGLLRKKTEQTDAALEAFEEVLARVPNHGDTHLELGELYAGPLAKPQRARVHWNAFLRHAPGHPRTAEIRERLNAL